MNRHLRRSRHSHEAKWIVIECPRLKRVLIKGWTMMRILWLSMLARRLWVLMNSSQMALKTISSKKSSNLRKSGKGLARKEVSKREKPS